MIAIIIAVIIIAIALIICYALLVYSAMLDDIDNGCQDNPQINLKKLT